MNKILIILSFVVIASCSPNESPLSPKEIPSGTLVERRGVHYEVNSETPFDGIAVMYHKNGQLQYKRNYKDGKRDGLTEGYYENGQLQYKVNYKDGKEHGLNSYYYDNGQLRYEENYKYGNRDGLEEWYYENGELKSKVCYKTGERTDMSYCEK